MLCFGYQQEFIPERYAGVPLLEKPINERRMIDHLRCWNIFSYSQSHEQETLFVRTVLTLYASLQAPYLHRETPGPHGFKGFCPVTESRLFERCRAMFPEFQHRIAVAEAHGQPLASFNPTQMAYARQLLAWTELGRPLTMSAFETHAVTEATLLPAEWE